MATAGRISGSIIQALRHLGLDQVDDKVLAVMRRRITDADHSASVVSSTPWPRRKHPATRISNRTHIRCELEKRFAAAKGGNRLSGTDMAMHAAPLASASGL